MWSQVFHGIVLTLAVSMLYQVNMSFFQVLMELIDTYEPLSPDPSQPNKMRIVWHAVVFGGSLALTLAILAMHPLSRKILLLETVNINYSLVPLPPHLPHPHPKQTRRQETQPDESESESESG
jgi:hypothetical protein